MIRVAGRYRLQGDDGEFDPSDGWTLASRPMKPADHAKLDYSPRDQLAIDWLLKSDEPGIRLQARRDLWIRRIGRVSGPSLMLTLNALRLLEVKRIRVVNLLPALVFAPLFVWLAAYVRAVLAT
ncbi:MAG: DUF554 family protein [Chloroflexota bacterium]